VRRGGVVTSDQRRYVTLRLVGRVEVGLMRPSERNLVLSSWTQGLADAAGHGRNSGSRHRDVYLARFGRLVEDTLSLPELVVLVARDAEDQALAYGWGAFSGDTVHWLSVKRAFRKLGVAHALLPSGMRYHAWSTRFDDVAKRYGLSLRPMETRRRTA
jgi:GNAT superfamily N-acetyltransferase